MSILFNGEIQRNSLQVHMLVGRLERPAFWCVRDFDSPNWWRAQECYFLCVILVIPTTIMMFSYGRIIFEICRVFKQRSKMATESIRRTSTIKQNQHLPSNQKGFPTAPSRKRTQHTLTSNNE